MVKTDFFNSERRSYMLSIVLIFALPFLSFYEATAQGLACNNSVQVSLNIDCEANITPGMILEGEDESGDYSVTISGMSGTIVTSPGTYSVTVTDNSNGNNCWGNITVEDKLAPIVEDCNCPPGNFIPECQFSCTDLAGILDGTVDVPEPTVTEECGSYTSAYSDEVIDAGCEEKIIFRSWLFTDESGNQTSGCTQQFRTVPASFADLILPVSPVELPCGSDVSMPAIVDYFTPSLGADVALTYGFPTINGVAINGTVCNLGATKVDVEIPVCDQSCSNSFKVIRDWTILDWCTTEVTTFNQIIKAVDNEAPTVDAQDMTVSTDPWICAANFYLKAPSVLHDDCTSFVDYTVSGPAGVDITWSPQFNLYYVSGVPKGIHVFTYIASDCCDNTAEDPIQVTILDQTPPVPVAKQNIVISLTQSANGVGFAKLYAPSVDNGSHDGCTDVHLEVRRDTDICNLTGNSTYNNDGHSFDSNSDIDNGQFVRFCCEDLTNAIVDVDGDGVNDPGVVKVWLRVWDDGDMNGTFGSSGDNFNETWAYVRVEDKLNPHLVCPVDITIDCDDDANDLDLTGSATGTFTCSDAEVEYTDIFNNIDNCGVGFITRRWNIVGNSSVTCDQRITKTAGDIFNGNITWPADYTTDCTDIDDNENVPTWAAPGCSQLGYSLESDTFQFEDGACFKIVNEWTVLDWCQYDANSTSNVGMWNHIQIIKVLDDEAPVINCADQMYAVDDYTDTDNDGNQCESISLMLTNSADDNGDCASEWLKWTVLVDVWGDGTYDYEFSSNLPIFDSNFNDTNGNGIPDVYLAPTSSGEEVKVTLPDDIQGSMSNHKVKWSVSDGCQNISSCENTFMVVDKKAPTPYCIDISTALMESGMVELWACDFDLGSFDNCTSDENLRFTFTDTKPQDDPLYNSQSKCSSRIFDCDDLALGTISVRMYVWDEKDNYDFCEVILSLLDNQGGCEDGAGMRISGKVSTLTNETVENLEVMLSAPVAELTKFDMTNEQGQYTFVNNPDGLNYEITAEKDDNYLDGVSTLDLVKIQRHILGLDQLTDAYKVIASDVNNDEKLSATDLLQLRKLILGITLELPTNDSYVVIDAAQEFNDVTDPWPLSHSITITPLSDNMTDQNFVAIKIGDVTENATYGLVGSQVTETRSNDRLNFELDNVDHTVGEFTNIDFNVADATQLTGLQMSINIEGMYNVQLTSDLIDIDASNYSINGSVMNISWVSNNLTQVNQGDVLFTLEGISNTDMKTSEVITMNQKSELQSEAYNHALDIMEINISSRNNEVVTSFAVIQNEPNPFSDITVIGYSIPENGIVNLSVTDITGKVVYKKFKETLRGKGTFSLNSNDLAQSGIYYYSVTSGDQTITNKMVLIK